MSSMFDELPLGNYQHSFSYYDSRRTRFTTRKDLQPERADRPALVLANYDQTATTTYAIRHKFDQWLRKK